MPLPSENRTLVVFDVDGTLVDGIALDHESFDLAFEEVVGRPLTEATWSTFVEVTSEAVFTYALRDRAEELPLLSRRMVESYLLKLRAGHERDASALPAFPGAVRLLTTLKESPDFAVAIATGCWQETAQFKLTAAGFDLIGIPFACSSDRPSRADIIALAAERAGIPVKQAIYVGDRPWDLRAARRLGIPFVGVGHKVAALREAGAEHLWDSLDLSGLAQLLGEIRNGKAA